MSRITFHNIQPFPYYLLLLPLFFVFHGYADYYDIVPLKEALFLLLRYETTALGLWVVFSFLFRNRSKAALFSFCLLDFHFFFGSLHDTFKNLFGNSFLGKYSFVLPFSLALLVLCFLLIKRSAANYNRISKYLTYLLLVLIAIDIPVLVFKTGWPKQKEEARESESFIACDTCARPDIYLIIADEYAGNEQLRALFHFDNKNFEEQLQKRGFHLVKGPRSNYNSTPFSVASMVNMNYLRGIQGNDDEKNDLKLCFEKINRNTIAGFFQSKGYQVINNSIFNFADHRTKNLIRFFPTNDRLISSQTFLARIQRDVLYHLYMYFGCRDKKQKPYYDVLLNNNKNLEQVWIEISRQSPKPRFVYTHLMMPHAPYYFDKDGNPLPPETYKENEFGKEKEYISYLQFSNNKFLELIDHILASSKAPPVIIFMSDHGFRYYDKTLGPGFQFMNINAIYLPSRRYEGFYDGMSNVNQFRVLLNTAFGQKLPLLKDSTVFIK